MAETSLKIVQISDLHLLADSSGELLGVPTTDSFEAVVSLIKSDNVKPDFIILSGDLSQDGADVSYTRIASILKDLQAPIYYVPGNHDNPKALARVFPLGPISSHKHIIKKSWQFILLNSQKVGAVEGFLDRTQLNFLQHCLQFYPEHRAMVVFHHPPVPMGSTWIDKIGLSNAKEFWEVASRYPKLAAVVFGHVHQEFAGTMHGKECYGVPSTCIQFKKDQAQFALDNQPPAYRLFELHDNGDIQTQVRRCANYIGKFDAAAKGY